MNRLGIEVGYLTRAPRSYMQSGAIFFLLPFFLVGCQTTSFDSNSNTEIQSTVPSSFRVSDRLERVAVFYPKTSMRGLADAYMHLEGATFQLKEQRPSLHIVERLDLATIRDEQLFQSSGSASDETAIGLGRILGVDGIVLYRISCPSFRDMFGTRFTGVSSPVTVTSKIILVESGEVVFHNVVTSQVEKSRRFHSFDIQPLVTIALARGVDQTISDLRHAFR